MTWRDRALSRFADWFQSAAGVWQTSALVVAWTVLILVDRRLDPNMFTEMAILTIYSAITQPALAYSSKRAADHAEATLARVADLEQRILDLEQQRLQP